MSNLIGIGMIVGMVGSGGIFAAAEIGGRRRTANIALGCAAGFFVGLAGFTVYGVVSAWLGS